MASDWAWLNVAIMYRSSSPGLAGKKRQKTSSMSSKMIVVLPVPPAPIKRHACCARFRKGVLFSSSCKATSIASPNHLQADNCSGASLNPPADFSNAATFRAIAADGLLKVRHLQIRTAALMLLKVTHFVTISHNISPHTIPSLHCRNSTTPTCPQ